jgi:hypothetical protein
MPKKKKINKVPSSSKPTQNTQNKVRQHSPLRERIEVNIVSGQMSSPRKGPQILSAHERQGQR